MRLSDLVQRNDMTVDVTRLPDRLDYLAASVQGLDVLDVGCVNHDLDARGTDDHVWLHALLCRHAAHVMGIDILPDAIERLRTEGYDVMKADATTVSLHKQFDVIVAGEVIEHIENPSALLRNLARHLKPEGSIFITTPNPFYILVQLQILIFGRLKIFNAEHVLWLCPYTMKTLAERSGLTLEKAFVFNHSRHPLLRLCSRLRTQWASNYLFELAPKGNQPASPTDPRHRTTEDETV
jgi:2-polyprenyl-3-methyl-5-hydroxy-6-metoxy-1,4-benzoquinol methylase